MINDPLRTWGSMFDDHAAGLYDLPPELLEARTALLRINEGLSTAQADRHDVSGEMHRLVAETRKAAAAGKPWPDVTSLEKVRTAEATRSALVQVLTDARAETASDLAATVSMLAPSIISDYLRPKHDEAAKQFRDLAAMVPAGVSGDEIVGAPDKTRKAWLEISSAVLAYVRIRGASDRLIRLAPPQHDEAGEFATMRNLTDVWPAFTGLASAVKTPPWPMDDDRSKYLWLIRNGADLWLPTAAERDKAWLEKYGEQVEQMRHHRAQARAFSQLGA